MMQPDLSSLDPSTRPVIAAMIAQLEQTIGTPVNITIGLPNIYIGLDATARARLASCYVDKTLVQYTVFNLDGMPERFVALRQATDVTPESLTGLTDRLRGINQPDWPRLISETTARRHPRNALTAECGSALEQLETAVGRLVDYQEIVENREVRWVAKEAVVALRFTKERVSFDFGAGSEALANPALKDRGPSASGDGYRRVELQIGKPGDATQSAAELIADALR